MSDIFDVIVAGLGPGGSSAAARLAAAGLSVLALEKYRLPRAKLCAGGLSPKAMALLDLDVGQSVEREVSGGVIYSHAGHSLEMYSETDSGLMVDRARFDQLLVSRAAAAGAQIHEGEAMTRITPGTIVAVETPRATYRGRFLVGADGANSLVARSLAYPMNHSGYALECFIPDTFELIRRHASRPAFYYGYLPSGYGWIFPKQGGGSVGIGVLWKHAREIRSLFAEFLTTLGLPEDYARRCKGHPLPAYTPGARKRQGKANVLLVGDAASLIDPITGEGIYYAMQSGQLAATAIQETLRCGGEAARCYGHHLKEIRRDLLMAYLIAVPLFAFPNMSLLALRENQEIARVLKEVVLGQDRYRDLLRVGLKAFFPTIRAFLRLQMAARPPGGALR